MLSHIQKCNISRMCRESPLNIL